MDISHKKAITTCRVFVLAPACTGGGNEHEADGNGNDNGVNGGGRVGGYRERTVVVCIENGRQSGVVEPATFIAYELFKPVGVTLEWHTASRVCQGQNNGVITVNLSTNTPPELHPGALAYAQPYESTHIQVFFDRIARGKNDLLPYLLGYVFAHEIAHVLQGVARHSDRGIMKAHWNNDDFALMTRRQVRFSDSDIGIIHDRMMARADHRTSAMPAVTPQ
jgi:hypothetical protein